MEGMVFKHAQKNMPIQRVLSVINLHVQEGHDHDGQNIPYSFFHKLSLVI